MAFPTEGLYGLGCDAQSAVAVEHLVAVRGREDGKPILVLVADLVMARTVAMAIPAAAERLAERFWPGPLTLVLPARPGLPPPLSAGTGTIGVRAPGHPMAAALVAAFGRPITAPSANPPREAPPRTRAAVAAYFGDRVAVYLDGGTLSGAPSTVVAVAADGLRILREGAISAAALRHTAGGGV